MLRVSARSSAELRAVILAMASVDRDTRKQLRAGTKLVAGREWERAMQSHASTTLEKRALADTARVTVTDQNVAVQSAGTRRVVSSGGLRPLEYGTAIEFGVGASQTTTYQSHRGATRFTVTRRSGVQLRPRRGDGYVFYPTAAQMIPRLLSMWVQTTVRAVAEALEAGGEK